VLGVRGLRLIVLMKMELPVCGSATVPKWTQTRRKVNAARLPSAGAPLYTARVPPDTLIVSDAHIGFGPPDAELAFRRFLDHVPDVADVLVINGDLFEFWFEYRSVIPKVAFPTLEALARVRDRGVRLIITGGNHDRWGGPFYREQLAAEFHPDGMEGTFAGFRALITHGDGLVEERVSARIFRRVVRNPVTTGVFRMLHPDIGYGLVRRMSPLLGGKTEDAAVRERATDRQVEYARALVRDRPEIRLVVLGHTHVARVAPLDGERWFVNPGSWVDGRRYARVGIEGPTLESFDG